MTMIFEDLTLGQMQTFIDELREGCEEKKKAALDFGRFYADDLHERRVLDEYKSLLRKALLAEGELESMEKHLKKGVVKAFFLSPLEWFEWRRKKTQKFRDDFYESNHGVRPNRGDK